MDSNLRSPGYYQFSFASFAGEQVQSGSAVTGSGSGLERVVAAETVLSHSDGARGIIWVRGYTLPEFVAEHGYEGSVALMWQGFVGTVLHVTAFAPSWAK
jgi:citrate synthase